VFVFTWEVLCAQTFVCGESVGIWGARGEGAAPQPGSLEAGALRRVVGWKVPGKGGETAARKASDETMMMMAGAKRRRADPKLP
jgi:hypothetical protein